tara:strand:- start:1924 stop:2652 length:729 start_codon:yes stop_codon:yes gene_type:complete
MSNNREKNFYQLNLDNYSLDIDNIRNFNNLQKIPRYEICQDSLEKRNYFKKDLIVELGSCRREECLITLAEKFSFKKGLGIDIFYKDIHNYKNINFIPHDLNEQWPLGKDSVDVLIAMMIIEHLFDPYFCFSEIKRVLKKDGIAFINLPLITNFRNRLRLLIGKIPTTSVPYHRWAKEKHWDGFHLHYFTIKSIFDLAELNDLKITRIDGIGKMKWLKNLFPSILCGEISFEIQHKNVYRED